MDDIENEWQNSSNMSYSEGYKRNVVTFQSSVAKSCQKFFFLHDELFLLWIPYTIEEKAARMKRWKRYV